MSIAAKTGRSMQTAASFFMGAIPTRSSGRRRGDRRAAAGHADRRAFDEVAGLGDHRVAGREAADDLDALGVRGGRP